ncbi:hypothetical protein [Deinococcus sp. UYEF24]
MLLRLFALLALTSVASAQTGSSVLPTYGAVFTSGGLMSARTLLVYDLRRGTLRSQVAPRGASPEQDTKLSAPIILTSQQREKVDQLLTVIAETKDKRVFVNPVPIADYIVWMQLRLGGPVISIDAYGPPRGKVDELNSYLWEIVSQSGK